jgi:hypothetical protein
VRSKSVTPGVGSGRANKYYIDMKNLAMDKRSSLFCDIVVDAKKVYTIAPSLPTTPMPLLASGRSSTFGKPFTKPES